MTASEKNFVRGKTLQEISKRGEVAILSREGKSGGGNTCWGRQYG